MIASIIISVVSLSHWNKKDSRGHYDGYENYDYEKYKKYYHDHYGKSGPPKAVSGILRNIIYFVFSYKGKDVNFINRPAKLAKYTLVNQN